MRKQKLAAIFLVLALSVACAVKNAPQIDRETQWRLNTASQLNDLQNDYLTFFKDVGDARRQGLLNDGQVASLNEVGHRLKPAIEIANREWQAYIAAPDGSKKAQVINLILEAEKIMLELSTKRTQIGGN